MFLFNDLYIYILLKYGDGMSKKIVLLLGAFVLMLNINLLVSRAETVDYQVGPVQSVNQVDKSKSYFDLRLAPSQEDDLQIKVINVTNKKINIITSVDRAITNHNGVVAYDLKTGKSTTAIPFKIEDILKTNEKNIVLEPNETKVVSYHVKMPNTEFEGVLSGGISFREEPTSQDKSKQSSMSIENQYGYVIAAVLHGKTEVNEPKLTLEKIKLGQINNRNVVYASLENIKAMYVNKLSVTAQINKKGSDKVLYNEKKESMQMAPNSILDYPINLNEQSFKPGKYTLAITATSKGHVWKFSKTFEIKAKEAKSLNKKAIINKKEVPYMIYGLILLGLLVVFLMIRYAKRKQNQIKNLEAQLKEKKDSN